jgi:hypothetical protein
MQPTLSTVVDMIAVLRWCCPEEWFVYAAKRVTETTLEGVLRFCCLVSSNLKVGILMVGQNSKRRDGHNEGTTSVPTGLMSLCVPTDQRQKCLIQTRGSTQGAILVQVDSRLHNTRFSRLECVLDGRFIQHLIR